MTFKNSTVFSSEPKTFRPAVSQALALSNDNFEIWRQFIYDKTGIYFQDNKKYLLESRLQKRINFLKLNSYDEYLQMVKSNSNGKSELKNLYEVITINETFFFRNQPQFDVLVSKIIPEIIKSKGRFYKKIRVWSAASSSGEEAYTTAIIFQDLIQPKFPDYQLEVVGTDINHAVIETARRGVYREYSIRNTSPYYLKKYFRLNSGSYELDPQIKRMVTFKVLNLNDTVGMKAMRSFDIIFCANVLIYFDNRAKIKTVAQLYNSLKPGGYLFIGYAETLHGISNAFKSVSFPKTIGYKKG